MTKPETKPETKPGSTDRPVRSDAPQTSLKIKSGVKGGPRYHPIEYG
ncbi:MAG: hypothetical protein KF729_12445 [Sandaracinaceae bacterium]|nr:hypothetical protein [Sandaracinaceae bacterium]